MGKILEKKNKVLVISASISRLSGGLFYSVRQLNENLCNYFDLKLLCLEDKFTNIDQNNWKMFQLIISKVSFGGLKIGFSFGLKRQAMKTFANIVHLNGIWMYTSRVAFLHKRLHSSKLIISPRGMLDPWALKNSSFKKNIIGSLYANNTLLNADCIHALNKSEYKSIREKFNNPIAVIPNGINIPEDFDRSFENKKIKNLLFLARIHPKKNVINLIHAFNKFRKKNNEWNLRIVGWGSESYVKEVKKLCDNKVVYFDGPKYGAEKEKILKKCDAYILPSFSEGLPMSVLEAWSYKLPTLITKHCNLEDSISNNIAISIGTSEDDIFKGLEKLGKINNIELLKVGNKSYKYVKDNYSWNTISKKMKMLYHWILDPKNKKKPIFVYEK